MPRTPTTPPPASPPACRSCRSIRRPGGSSPVMTPLEHASPPGKASSRRTAGAVRSRRAVPSPSGATALRERTDPAVLREEAFPGGEACSSRVVTGDEPPGRRIDLQDRHAGGDAGGGVVGVRGIETSCVAAEPGAADVADRRRLALQQEPESIGFGGGRRDDALGEDEEETSGHHGEDEDRGRRPVERNAVRE